MVHGFLVAQHDYESRHRETLFTLCHHVRYDHQNPTGALFPVTEEMIWIKH